MVHQSCNHCHPSHTHTHTLLVPIKHTLVLLLCMLCLHAFINQSINQCVLSPQPLFTITMMMMMMMALPFTSTHIQIHHIPLLLCTNTHTTITQHSAAIEHNSHQSITTNCNRVMACQRVVTTQKHNTHTDVLMPSHSQHTRHKHNDKGHNHA